MACINVYDVGDALKLGATITDIAGDPIDPAALFFKIRRPDGTSTEYEYLVDAAVVRTSTGVYYLNYVTTMAGIHYYSYRVPGSQAAYQEASFRVRVKRG